jgi:hypothetical protein
MLPNVVEKPGYGSVSMSQGKPSVNVEKSIPSPISVIPKLIAAFGFAYVMLFEAKGKSVRRNRKTANRKKYLFGRSVRVLNLAIDAFPHRS